MGFRPVGDCLSMTANGSEREQGMALAGRMWIGDISVLGDDELLNRCHLGPFF
jgi:hypothetical protein